VHFARSLAGHPSEEDYDVCENPSPFTVVGSGSAELSEDGSVTLTLRPTISLQRNNAGRLFIGVIEWCPACGARALVSRITYGPSRGEEQVYYVDTRCAACGYEEIDHSGGI
jgi:hypothetical protein